MMTNFIRKIKELRRKFFPTKKEMIEDLIEEIKKQGRVIKQ